jgi:hypothetical protein
MSTADKYAIPTDVTTTWDVPAHGSARFSWEYDDGRDRLLSLYQKGKDKQWDSTKRIDWSIEVEPTNPVGMPEMYNPFMGTPVWNKMNQKERDNFTHHQAAWTWSQFLHGEQGAMICAARIVETVPDNDSKFYGATQVMDEARHVETFARFLQDKVGTVFPMNQDLASLLKDALEAKEWDYFGTWPRTRWPSSSSRTSCRTRRGMSPSAGWRCGTPIRSSRTRSARSARTSWSKVAG